MFHEKPQTYSSIICLLHNTNRLDFMTAYKLQMNHIICGLLWSYIFYFLETVINLMYIKPLLVANMGYVRHLLWVALGWVGLVKMKSVFVCVCVCMVDHLLGVFYVKQTHRVRWAEVYSSYLGSLRDSWFMRFDNSNRLSPFVTGMFECGNTRWHWNKWFVERNGY